MNSNMITLVGQTFGELEVKEYAGKDKQGFAMWKCLCSCGNYKNIRGTSLRTTTKSCGHLQKESARIQGKKNRKHGLSKTKEYYRSMWLLRTYGITSEEYENLLKSQDYKCAICKRLNSDLDKTLCVDHDHKNGQIRGILCDNCNNLLGRAEDNIETLKSAIQYLENRGEQYAG